MKTTMKTLAMTLLALCISGPSHAGYIVNLTESGGDVIGNGSGTIDTAALTYLGGDGNYGLWPSLGFAILGTVNHAIFEGVSGPVSFR